MGKYSKVYKACLKSNPAKIFAIKQIDLRVIEKDELAIIR